jgi:F0F1-type ATP synthase assembly protein I
MEGKRTPEDKGRRELRTTAQALALIGQIGLTIALPPVFGGLAGQYLDHQVFHDPAPLATVFGLLLGLAAGITLAVRSVLRLT